MRGGLLAEEVGGMGQKVLELDLQDAVAHAVITGVVPGNSLKPSSKSVYSVPPAK